MATPDPSTAVHNERTKLLANALDRASTANYAVGVVAPLASVLYAGVAPPLPLFVLGTLFWIVSGFVLHLAARVVLGRLRT